MHEQDPQVRLVPRDGEVARLRPRPRPLRARIGAGDVHAPAANVDRHALVREQPRRRELAAGTVRSTNGSRLIARSWLPRIAYAVRQPRQEPAQRRLARCAREQVAADERQVGLPLLDPVDRASRPRALARPGTPRWKSERCAIRSPSSSGGRPGSRDVARVEPHPPRLEPRPAERGRRELPQALSGLELLEDRLDRDDVPLEPQLRLLEARRRRRSAARGAGSACGSPGPSTRAASTATRRATGGRAGTA